MLYALTNNNMLWTTFDQFDPLKQVNPYISVWRLKMTLLVKKTMIKKIYITRIIIM
ncbi:hypothetical protein HanXRQr2_Chr08g0351481 [Helianthus annuus]|uniref:Uncharacterized protein n=1 Tax=Helianthus annuus TaxID=4232 RepID=A0A9K3IH39_HELAN|nr:hypothetical protein HanXRQr2_Chr08g0351481 [Helianthus annuus]KAJ0902648.1 hypothetical protein HanPSC8_Chr08g0339481 [Helianthus annuus]